MLHIDRIYNEYPELVCSMMEHIYRIDGTPKMSIPKLVLREVKEKVGLKNAISDVLTAMEGPVNPTRFSTTPASPSTGNRTSFSTPTSAPAATTAAASTPARPAAIPGRERSRR